MAPPVTHTPHFLQLAPIRIHCIPMAPLPVANSWHSSTALFGKTLLDSEAGKESINPQMHSHMHPSTLHPFTYPCTHPDLPVLHAQLLSLLPLLTQGCQKHPKIFYALRAAPKILNSCGIPGSCCPWGRGKDPPTPCPDGFSQEKKRFSWFCFQGTHLGKSSSCHSSFTSTFSIRSVASVVPMALREGLEPADPSRKGSGCKGEAERLAWSIPSQEQLHSMEKQWESCL